MTEITSSFIRIAAATVLALECVEAAGFGHGQLPLGGSHEAQIAVLLGASVVLAELTELVIKPTASRLGALLQRAWSVVRRVFSRHGKE